MSDFIYNPGAPGPMTLNEGSFGSANAQEKEPTLRSADHIVKFKLELPSFSSGLITPQYKELYAAYEQLGGTGGGTSFVLYALIQDFSESVEQAVTNKRSKGGFVENHWGPRPSVVSASGQIGVHLSAFGLTPYHVEDPDGGSETVLDWDPTASAVLTDNPTASAGVGVDWSGKLQQLGNDLIHQAGANQGGSSGALLQSFSASGSTASSSSKPILASGIAARTGTNLAIRKFRMILDLFKMNGVVFDTIPNPDIFPFTYVAPERYFNVEKNTFDFRESLINQHRESGVSLDSLRRDEGIAPGNVRAVLPITMYVKDTVYTGFFETFNYQMSEDNPFSAHYDFTFKTKNVQRTALFFPDGSAGRMSHSLIVNQNATPWRR